MSRQCSWAIVSVIVLLQFSERLTAQTLDFDPLILPASYSAQGHTDATIDGQLIWYARGNKIYRHDGVFHDEVFSSSGDDIQSLVVHPPHILWTDGLYSYGCNPSRSTVDKLEALPAWQDDYREEEGHLLATDRGIYRVTYANDVDIKKVFTGKDCRQILSHEGNIYVLCESTVYNLSTGKSVQQRFQKIFSNGKILLGIRNGDLYKLDQKGTQPLLLDYDIRQGLIRENLVMLWTSRGQYLYHLESRRLESIQLPMGPIRGSIQHGHRIYIWDGDKQGFLQVNHLDALDPNARLIFAGPKLVQVINSEEETTIKDLQGRLLATTEKETDFTLLYDEQGYLLLSPDIGIVRLQDDSSRKLVGPDSIAAPLHLHNLNGKNYVVTNHGLLVPERKRKQHLWKHPEPVRNIHTSENQLCIEYQSIWRCIDSEGLISEFSAVDYPILLVKDSLISLEDGKLMRTHLRTDKSEVYYRADKTIKDAFVLPGGFLLKSADGWTIYDRETGKSRPINCIPPDCHLRTSKEAPFILCDQNKAISIEECLQESSAPQAYLRHLRKDGQIIRNMVDKSLPVSENTQTSIDIGQADLLHPDSYQARIMVENDQVQSWKDDKTFQIPESSGPRILQYQVRNSAGQISDWEEVQIIPAPKSLSTKLWWIALAALGLLISGLFSYYAHLRKRRKKREEQRYQKKTKQKLLNLEQKALQSQMNPHFIFNGIQSIRNRLEDADHEQTDALILRFSQYTRKVLLYSRAEKISLSDEMEFLEEYVALESDMRNRRITIDYHGDALEEKDLIDIPPFCLQPIVENAIKHGIAPSQEGDHITITFTDKDDLLLCQVKDNGVGLHHTPKKRKSEAHLGQATKIIQERLAQYHNKAITFENVNDEKPNKSGTVVRLYLPIIEAI